MSSLYFSITNYFQKLVLGAWILALMCCTPQLLIFNTSQKKGCSSGEMFEKCETHFPTWISPSQYVLYFSFANFFLPLLVLLFSNCFICRTIWASSSNMLVFIHMINIIILRVKLQHGN